MKKISALLLAFVLSVSLLAGCGNALYDDLENYLNVEMTEVNANYEKIKTEAGAWENLDDDDALKASITDTMLPLINDSLDRLGKITPETEEVKAVKDKYVLVMEAYKEGFEKVLEGINALDEDIVLAGNEKIENAVTLLDEYNTALESLAEEVGAEIEY